MKLPLLFTISLLLGQTLAQFQFRDYCEGMQCSKLFSKKCMGCVNDCIDDWIDNTGCSLLLASAVTPLDFIRIIKFLDDAKHRVRVHAAIPVMPRKVHDQVFSTSGGGMSCQWGTFYQWAHSTIGGSFDSLGQSTSSEFRLLESFFQVGDIPPVADIPPFGDIFPVFFDFLLCLRRSASHH